MAQTSTGSDEPGFIQVHCHQCGNPDVWLKCEQCGKSDNFRFEDGTVTCSCGATYTHAKCTCGAQVPPEGSLSFVRFDEGPKALADLEIAWERVAVLLLIVAGLGATLWWSLS